MSTARVHLWADGFGLWHARVTCASCADARAFAYQGIADQLTERGSLPHQSVELVEEAPEPGVPGSRIFHFRERVG